MSKTKSIFDKFTWIVTELILGAVGLSYGLYGIITSSGNPVVIYIILCVGGVLLIAGIIQIMIWKRKKKKVSKFCSKCGQKIKKEDEFCPKCGEKIT